MKISIFLESQEDLTLVLPLLHKVDQIQKEGKYIFYRLVCFCNAQVEQELQHYMIQNILKVPYAFYNKSESQNGSFETQTKSMIHEELSTNPADLVMIMQHTEIPKLWVQIYEESPFKIAILNYKESDFVIPIASEFIFTPKQLHNPGGIVTELIHRFNL